jgi:hypothetical protein
LLVGSGDIGGNILVSEKTAAVDDGTNASFAFGPFFFLTRALNPDI